jgi:hypothetical protein
MRAARRVVPLMNRSAARFVITRSAARFVITRSAARFVIARPVARSSSPIHHTFCHPRSAVRSWLPNPPHVRQARRRRAAHESIHHAFVIPDPPFVRHHPTRRTFVVNRVAARFSPPGRRIRAHLQFVLRRSTFVIEHLAIRHGTNCP